MVAVGRWRRGEGGEHLFVGMGMEKNEKRKEIMEKFRRGLLKCRELQVGVGVERMVDCGKGPFGVS